MKDITWSIIVMPFDMRWAAFMLFLLYTKYIHEMVGGALLSLYMSQFDRSLRPVVVYKQEA